MDSSDIKNMETNALIMEWMEWDRVMKQAKGTEAKLRKEVEERLFKNTKAGTQNHDLGNDWKIKCTRPETIKLVGSNAEIESSLHEIGSIKGGYDIARLLVKWSPSLDKKTYNKMEELPEAKAIFDNFVEKSLGAARLEVVPPKGVINE